MFCRANIAQIHNAQERVRSKNVTSKKMRTYSWGQLEVGTYHPVCLGAVKAGGNPTWVPLLSTGTYLKLRCVLSSLCNWYFCYFQCRFWALRIENCECARAGLGVCTVLQCIAGRIIHSGPYSSSEWLTSHVDFLINQLKPAYFRCHSKCPTRLPNGTISNSEREKMSQWAC